ncbi:helix-turn-helix domain-containing protein [Paraburkholderia phymatum]|nr:helix-turn-helix domain-containing protein [Paraburkholderia phymatum]
MSKKQVAIVLPETSDLLSVSTLAELLQYASDLSHQKPAGGVSYETHYLSPSGGYVRCAFSISVSTRSLDEALEHRFDHVLIASARQQKHIPFDAAHAPWLERMRSRGASIVMLSAGAGGGASAGAAASSSAGQGAQAQTATYNGAQSALRAAFNIVRWDLGDELAMEAMRLASGQRDVSAVVSAALDTVGGPAAKARFAARWIRENCHRALSVADIADACAASERSLLRYFQMHMGMSPSEYLQQIRLETACELLATTSLPADKIARRVGLGNGNRLGKILRRVTGVSPMEYRAASHLSA